MIRILEERPEQFICVDETGTTFSRPNSPYYSEKHRVEEDRIAYKFNETNYVQETFDARIFNCYMDGVLFQFRQDLSDRLCETIQGHRAGGDLTEYKKLWNHAVREIPLWHVLDYYLKGMGNVKRDGEAYIINDVFRVNKSGNAQVKSNGAWRGICIVVSNLNEHDQIVTPEGEFVFANDLTITIIAKVYFLLHPNTLDHVFMNQLPKQISMALSNKQLE